MGIVSGTGTDISQVPYSTNRNTGKKRARLVLMGKVMCKIDADKSPIQTSDLLTTSSTKVHAMKCAKPAQSRGAVIGQALEGLSNEIGMIPILVNL